MQTRCYFTAFDQGQDFNGQQRFSDDKSFWPALTAVFTPFSNHGPIKSSLECWRGRGGDKLIASN